MTSTRTPVTQHGTANGYRSGCRCLGCTYAIRQHNERYRRANSKKVKQATRQREIKKRYGITLEDLAAMKRAQGYRCAICRALFPRAGLEGKRMHVDHCHRTNRIRGLLCAACNSGLGKLGDSVEGLRRAIAYLEGFEQTP